MNLRLKTRVRILRRTFKQFLTRKLSTQLVLTYIALGVFPLIIVSIFLISITQNTVKSYIYQRNLETARRASNEIALFIREPITILRTLVQTQDILNMEPFSQNRIINKIKEENTIFRKLFVLDSTGIVLATTSFGEEFLNFRNAPFFMKGKAGEEFFSDVYFTPSRFPVMLMAHPISRLNKVVGVLVAEIDLKNIWDLVDNITIGKSGYAFLLSGDGIVIAHKNKEKVLERENYSQYPFFKYLIGGKEGVTEIILENQRVLVAYFPVPIMKWGIVIQQSVSEAFTLAKQLQYRVFFFLALTAIIAAFLGIMGVRRFTKPLEKIVEGARIFARGNLSHRIEIHRKDELAELAQEFNAMARSLQKNQKELQRMERLAALSRFAALVSHEVRNPLNSMNINMQILKRLMHRDDILPEQKVKYLNVISEEISRINELVTSFLTITRPPELNLIRADLHQILQDIILVQKARAGAEGIEIIARLDPNPLTGMFDHSQLKQVFHNIIINAFEAMPDGGTLEIITQRIDNSASEQRNYARIIFKDSGVGIDEHKLRDVFDFYYTTKKTGTGLGLAIAKQIIEAHKGRIYIKSQLVRGTSVFIELPID